MMDFSVDGQTCQIDILDLHDALQELGRIDADAARIIDLRSFSGLTLQEAADAQGCSFAIARGHWEYAKAWLSERLSRNAR